MIEELSNLLKNNKLTISTAESCTGGLIAKTFTDLPGSSRWFDSGVVSYSNQAKVHFLKVPEDLIDTHGAVSEAVASAMAKGVREATGTNLSLATSGIAGPGGGSIEKPVGTVCFGFCFADKSYTQTKHFSGNREAIRSSALTHVIEELIRELSL